MLSIQIQNQLDFMKKLLVGETFDSFLLSEASITTFAAFHIDGTFHPDYFGEKETETLNQPQSRYTAWRRVRPFFLELTKGKHTPLSFRIIFRLAPHNVEKLTAQCGSSPDAEQVDGLFLNIRFDGSFISCTSGVSLRVFSLDKSLEYAWDEMLKTFFQQNGISFV